jgi:hypothetical protein
MLLAVVVAIGAPLAGKHGTKHTLGVDAAAADAVTCGVRGLPACEYYDPTRAIIVHQCSSDGNPTIGAVITSSRGATNVTYMCKPCGEPGEEACECTHDNTHNRQIHVPDHIPHPCIGAMSHWCRYQPQYISSSEDGIQYNCVQNVTDAPQQQTCGTIDQEACLNIYSMAYSCTSPDPQTGVVVDAVLFDPDIIKRHNPNAAQMCKLCGTEGAYACDCSINGNCPTAPAGTTIFCEAGLNMVDSDIPGKFYCNSPQTLMMLGDSPSAPPSSPADKKRKQA